MIKILTISDQHGLLSPLDKIEPADLCLISGDICPHFKTSYVGDYGDCLGQSQWLSLVFKPWMDALPVKQTYFCWGNHDWVGEKTPHLLPSFANPKNKINCIQDDFVVYKGLKIWFSPWSLYFFGWAFNAPEEGGEEFLKQKYDQIPNDTDIIVSHTCPHGYGDKTNTLENTGPISLFNRMVDIKPKLIVGGHIHCDRNIFKYKNTTIVNASVVDEKYRLVNNGTLIEI